MRHLMNLETVNTYEGTHDVHVHSSGVHKRACRPLQALNRTFDDDVKDAVPALELSVIDIFAI